MSDEARAYMHRARGVSPHDVCPKCDGSGSYCYPNTATWDDRPGLISGQGFTWGVCDACWGSGKTSRPGTDLRKIAEQRRRLFQILRQQEHRPALVGLIDSIKRIFEWRR